jgi:ATP-dependent helicase HrpA
VKLEVLVKGLPKAIRKRLVPLNETVDIIFREMPRQKTPFLTALGDFVHKRFGVDIPSAAWTGAAMPDHLKMRVAITAPGGRELASGGTRLSCDQPTATGSAGGTAGLGTCRDSRWDFGDRPDALTARPRGWLSPRPSRRCAAVFAHRDRAGRTPRVAALLPFISPGTKL